MSYSDTIQQNSVGVQFIVTVVDEFSGQPVSIPNATNLQILFFLPNQSILAVTATFYKDGTDGKITYTTNVGDLSLAGIYRIQAAYMLGTNQRYTSLDNFKVLLNVYSL